MSASSWGAAVGGVAVALGIAFAGIAVGTSFIDSKRASRTVVVKGLAEREVQADVASWRVPFRGVAASTADAIASAMHPVLTRMSGVMFVSETAVSRAEYFV